MDDGGCNLTNGQSTYLSEQWRKRRIRIRKWDVTFVLFPSQNFLSLLHMSDNLDKHKYLHSNHLWKFTLYASQSRRLKGLRKWTVFESGRSTRVNALRNGTVLKIIVYCDRLFSVLLPPVLLKTISFWTCIKNLIPLMKKLHYKYKVVLSRYLFILGLAGCFWDYLCVLMMWHKIQFIVVLEVEKCWNRDKSVHWLTSNWP